MSGWKLPAVLAVTGSLSLHGLALSIAPSPEAAQIAGGAGAALAMVGNSFEDLVSGSAFSVPPDVSSAVPHDNTLAAPQPAPQAVVEPPAVPPEAVAVKPTQQVQSRPVESLPPIAPGDRVPASLTAAAPQSAAVPAASPPQPPLAKATAVEAQTPEPAPSSPVPNVAPARPVAPEPPVLASTDAAPETSPPPKHRPTRTAEAPKPQQPQTRGGDRDAKKGVAEGSAKGVQAAKAGRAGGAEGNAGADNYPGLVMKKLSRTSRPRLRDRGAATVAFTVTSAGGLGATRILRSTGSAEVERAALDLVRRAAPFPPPPAGAMREFSFEFAGG